MIQERFYRDRRAVLLQRWKKARAEYQACRMRMEKLIPWSEEEIGLLAEAERIRGEMARAESSYFAEVPRLAMGVCPFCEAALVRSFDAYGFDGLWWRADAVAEEHVACVHFQMLSGAVAYGGLAPEAGSFEVRPGPEAPFVIRALISRAGVVAVIGRIAMKNGYVAYPVSYFAETKLSAEVLTAEWRRSIYNYTSASREDYWRIPADEWQFDLRKPLEAGSLRWCPPDSENMLLHEPGMAACPYLDLPGRRENVVLGPR